MDLNELRESFVDKKIEKRTYWRMMREKYVGLLEYKKFLNSFDEETSICIKKDDIILTYHDIKLAFDFSQSICRAEGILNMEGNPEQDDFDFLISCISDGDVFMDIGANVGVVSLYVNRQIPQVGAIYSFEPLPPTYEQLKHNIFLNENMDKIHTFNIGLSDKKGNFDFYLPGADEAASMQPNMDEYYMRECINGIYTGKKKIEKISCEVDTLDSFVVMHNIEKVDVIKIDTEGNEYAVLRGGANVLRKCTPLIYAEMLRKHAARFGYHPDEIIDFMGTLGYSCFVFSEGQLRKFEHMSENTVESNFFFLHEEKHRGVIDKFV